MRTSVELASGEILVRMSANEAQAVVSWLDPDRNVEWRKDLYEQLQRAVQARRKGEVRV